MATPRHHRHTLQHRSDHADNDGFDSFVKEPGQDVVILGIVGCHCEFVLSRKNGLVEF